MRKLFIGVFFVLVLVAAIGIGVGLGVHWTGLTHDMSVTVDGDRFDGSIVAAALGGSAMIAAIVVGMIVVAVLASVALIVPLALLAAAGAVLAALVVGLSPILIPVLLVVGAYALLTRRRNRATRPMEMPANVAPATSSTHV